MKNLMKILHFCVSYNDNYSYQENLLPKYNKLHGHEVEIIASTRTRVDNNYISNVKPSRYYTGEGIKIIRIPFVRFLPSFVSEKLHWCSGLYQLLEEFQPDIIMFHNIASCNLLTVSKYAKKHSNVKFYCDNHGDFINSARNFLSRVFLHKIVFYWIVKRCMPFIDKVLYLSEGTRDFLIQNYRVSPEKLEFYPLGGEVINTSICKEWRETYREQLGIDKDTLVLMHTGRLDILKKTDMILDAIDNMKEERIVLLISGSIPSTNRILWERIQNNDKVKWLGWLDSESLKHYLCACDVYIQPGGQSATMQQAVCCGLPLLLYPHTAYVNLCKENAVWVKDKADIEKAISTFLHEPVLLSAMKRASENIARNILDYHVLARRIES